MYRPVYFLILVLFLGSCKTTSISKTRPIDIRQEILSDSILQDHLTGFLLFDMEEQKPLIELNSTQLFTPASNAKILSLWTALNILKDSVELIQFYEKEDKFIFRGTGFPLTLNQEVNNDSSLIELLMNEDKSLVYCDHFFNMNIFGSGWAWDDAIYSYQRFLSPLPLYANVINLKSENQKVDIYPTFFEDSIDIELGESYKRNNIDGRYLIQLDSQDRIIDLPMIYKPGLTMDILSNVIDKRIEGCNEHHEDNDFEQKLSVQLLDSMYIRLMHQSDNFISEQLLLMCSNKILDTINTAMIIDYAMKEYFQEQPEIRWVDGSGLSRYNLMSPIFLVQTLNQIYALLGDDGIQLLFPAGGYSGTIEDYYIGANGPYVYAKTGTLSNNHNLSGYIYTHSGRVLSFSFMNNHYLGSSSKVKKAMEGILWMVYKQY